MAELEIGSLIRRLRIHRKLTPTELADRMDRPRTYIYKIEQGQNCPNLENLCRFGSALGYDGWKLLRRAEREARMKEWRP